MAKRCCGKALIQQCALDRSASLGSQLFDTTEGALGLLPVLPSPVGRSKVLGSEVNLSHALREEPVTGDSASVGTEAGRACLRVTTRASEVEAVSVKAPRGPRRSERGQHPPATEKVGGREVRRNACGRS